MQMIEPWPLDLPGVLELPSGRLVRGHGLSGVRPSGPDPTYAVYLGVRPVDPPEWARECVRWRDFWLPAHPEQAAATLQRAWDRTEIDRVEFACAGGVGRTGTALTALCVLEGLNPNAAVRWVRQRYHRGAVEVPWQRYFLHQVALADGRP